jgi:hypothetical protein
LPQAALINGNDDDRHHGPLNAPTVITSMPSPVDRGLDDAIVA